MDRLRKKLCEQESMLLLLSPSMAFRVHNRNGKVILCILCLVYPIICIFSSLNITLACVCLT